MWHRMDGGLKRALAAASEDRQSGGALGTMDLLRGIARTPESVGARVLVRLGVAISPTPTPGEQEEECTLGAPLTEAARRIVEAIYNEAVELRDHHVGTEHVLLALTRAENQNGAAGRVLATAGATRFEIARALLAEQETRFRAPRGVPVPGLLGRRAKAAAREVKPAVRQAGILVRNLRHPVLAYVPRARALSDNPYPLYAKLRKRGFYWEELLGAWVVMDYEGVTAALAEPRFVTHSYQSYLEEGHEPLPPTLDQAFNVLYGAVGRQMLFQDPPDQTRLRRLVAAQFTPRVIADLRTKIQTIADELLDAVGNKPGMEVVADFAFPLPAIAIARMLGVGADDLGAFKHWAEHFARFIGGGPSLARDVEVRKSLLALDAYFRAAIVRLRARPTDNLLSLLIQAEEQGDRLTTDEIVANCLLLLAAGHETTMSLISCGLLALFENPAEREKLAKDPSLIEPAVEEFLRRDSPIQWTVRVAREDMTWSKRALKAGQWISIGLGAANRDPARFDDPDRLDVCRANNRHLAFSHGSHFCLGASLARIEGQIALAALLSRFPNIRLDPHQPPRWQTNFRLRSLARLPVVF